MSLEEYMEKYNVTFNELCKAVDSNLKVIWRWRNGRGLLTDGTHTIGDIVDGEVLVSDDCHIT